MIKWGKRSRRTGFVVLGLTLFFVCSADAGKGHVTVETGRKVAFEYTLLLPDGFMVETNIGAEPFEYVHGHNEILPRIEQELAGLAVDDEKSITLEPEDAYGSRDPQAVQEVPIEEVPYDARIVGAPFAVAGYSWPVLVREVRSDAIVLDLNHPLAGRTLVFNIRIVSIS